MLCALRFRRAFFFLTTRNAPTPIIKTATAATIPPIIPADEELAGDSAEAEVDEGKPAEELLVGVEVGNNGGNDAPVDSDF